MLAVAGTVAVAHSHCELAARDAPSFMEVDMTTPAKQLAGFIAKFDPAIASLARSCRTILRKRFPTALELVYDNYNALAIGYASTERASDCIVSLAVFPRSVALSFYYGAS